MPIDQRKSKRYVTELPATAWLGNDELPCIVRNASHDGMYIETAKPPPLTRLLQIEVILPNERASIRVSAMGVYRGDPTKGEPTGVGVRFVCLDADAEDRWNRFVLHLERSEPAPQSAASKEATASSNDRRVVRAAAPELRITVADPDELRALATDILAGRELMIETSLVVPLGTKLWLTLVSPTARRAMSVASTVRGVYAEQKMSGVAVAVQLEHGERTALTEFSNAPGVPAAREGIDLGFDEGTDSMRRSNFDGLFD